MSDINKTPDELRDERERQEERIKGLESALAQSFTAFSVLQEREEQYRMLVENLPDVIWTADSDGQRVYVSPRVEEVSGFTPQEIYSAGEEFWFGRIHPDDRGMVRAAYGNLLKKGTAFGLEYRILRRDGAWIWLNDRAFLRATKEGKRLAHGVFRDVTARKRAEEELRQSEEKYRDLFDSAVDAIFILDQDFRYVDVNHRAVELFGYSREEFRSMGIFDVIPPDQVPRTEGELRTLKERGRYEKFRGKMRTKEGQWLDIEVSSSAIMQDGRVLGARDIVRDITAQKRAEEDRHRSQEQLQLLIDRMPVGCIMWDTGFRVALWNPAAEKIFGYSALEALGKHAYDLIVPKEAQGRVDGVWNRLLVGDQSAHSENGNITADGRKIICEWYNTPIREAGGRVTWVLSMVLDVTDRKRSEEGLRKNEEKYRTIFNNASVSLWEEDFSEVKAALDAVKAGGAADFRKYLDDHPEFVRQAWEKMKVLDVNDSTLQLYDARSKDELFRAMDRIVTPEAGTAMKELLTAIAEGKTSFRTETTNRTLAGTTMDILITIAIPSETSSFKNLLVSIMDITEHRRADAERRKLEAQLLQSQKMEAIGLLAGGVAHDFNNILSAILGYASILQMKMRSDDPLRPNVDQVLAASQRAATLTQSLLAFSRKQIINPQPLHVNENLRKIEKLLRRIIGEDIEFTTAFAQPDMTVIADAGHLEQVIINLATNARDAMPQGGAITLETCRAEIDEEFIRRHGYGKAGSYAMIAMTDTGTGMDEKTRARIFEPFFTTKELGKGTGLGLSMAYGIVKQNNGIITCHSEPGAGTTFRIYLPIVAAGARKDASAEPVVAGRGAETVLIAEDDQTMRDLFRALLADHGYTVITAGDGDDALAKFRERPGDIQLIVLDVVMPKKNGKEVYEEARRLRPGVKALFISGYTADIVKRKGIMEEGLHFLSKPSTPAVFLRTIRDILDSR